ncbi:hypothetical protein E2986_03719 [Frieseomelitta varia]|uniref:Uncharacterized protein n=1 Tax=Frieseomelitta varia TaxID=561572 RepID=A0A833SJP1_9HYME|nr:hypothetical protein E2986_03719 [Frieseomelitta varia]
MFRSIAGVLIVALSLHQAAFAIDVSQDKNVRVEFTSNDAVQQTKSVSDLEMVVQPAKLCQVQAHSISERLFSFVAIDENNSISARNVQGSQAVVCGSSNALGASKTSISLRVPPNSLATLNMVVAAHDRNRKNLLKINAKYLSVKYCDYSSS